MLRLALLVLALTAPVSLLIGSGRDLAGFLVPSIGDVHGNLDPNGVQATGDLHGNLDPDG
ncbi:MAG TPA: hypothetical protein VEG34_11165 [Thermoanaerobaculia bacterium]|nr:hypothetical protein [Thermoanaerobaculia bacterium]